MVENIDRQDGIVKLTHHGQSNTLKWLPIKEYISELHRRPSNISVIKQNLQRSVYNVST
jgi:hypothetical protein